jgi:phage baseplate assembly protein gpV
MKCDRVVHARGAQPERVARAEQAVRYLKTGEDTLVWMYERLAQADRRRFWTLATPGERLLFLVDGGSSVREERNA